MIQTGVELAIKHINEAGGVNGQDVVFVTGDTQVDPTTAVEEARRLIEVEGVHALVGTALEHRHAGGRGERARGRGHPGDFAVGNLTGDHERRRTTASSSAVRLPMPRRA